MFFNDCRFWVVGWMELLDMVIVIGFLFIGYGDYGWIFCELCYVMLEVVGICRVGVVVFDLVWMVFG